MDFELVQKKIIWVGLTQSGELFIKDWALFEAREMKSVRRIQCKGESPLLALMMERAMWQGPKNNPWWLRVVFSQQPAGI